jgi:hypothetical protein
LLKKLHEIDQQEADHVGQVASSAKQCVEWLLSQLSLVNQALVPAITAFRVRPIKSQFRHLYQPRSNITSPKGLEESKSEHKNEHETV